MFPRAFSTANVAQALLTTWCAKKPGNSGSSAPARCGALGSDEVGIHLNRNIRAWSGCKAASESGSRE